MELLPCFIMPFMLLISLAGTIFWIWTIIDCASKEPSEGNEKIIWIIIIVFTQVIGSLIYFFVRRPQRIQQYGQ